MFSLYLDSRSEKRAQSFKAHFLVCDFKRKIQKPDKSTATYKRKRVQLRPPKIIRLMFLTLKPTSQTLKVDSLPRSPLAESQGSSSGDKSGETNRGTTFRIHQTGAEAKN